MSDITMGEYVSALESEREELKARALAAEAEARNLQAALDMQREALEAMTGMCNAAEAEATGRGELLTEALAVVDALTHGGRFAPWGIGTHRVAEWRDRAHAALKETT